MTTTKRRWWRSTERSLGRDIALAVALKIVLVAALYLLLIRPAFHPASDAHATAAAVAGYGGKRDTLR